MIDERIITFIVTKDCQLRCRYCYLVGKNKFQKMTFEVAQHVCDCLIKTSLITEAKSIVLDFIGGEPLLEIAMIGKTVEYFIEKVKSTHLPCADNISLRITTNGLLYSTHDVQQFINKYKDILEISISIDGTKAKNDCNRIFPSGEGSYNHIINNVCLWISQFQKVGTKMVISHDDLPYIFESAKHLLKLGIYKLDMNTVVEDVWKEGDDIVFEQQLIRLADYILDNNLQNNAAFYIFEESIGNPIEDLSQKASPCGTMTISIDGRGMFFSCLRFADFSLREKSERSIGNIYDGLYDNRLRPLMSMDYLSLMPEKCRNCEIATGCKWCPAENYDSSSTGTIFEKPFNICKMHSARVRAKNYYHRKLQQMYGD